jgi:hypothetical protein
MALDDYHAGPKRRKNMTRVTEDVMHQQAVQYVSLRYRDVPLRTDYAAGLGLNKVQARKHARMQGNTRAWPDIQLAKPVKLYAGLFIELKAPDVELFMRRDGTTIRQDDYKVRLKGDWANIHYEEQAKMLEKLRQQGYWADFAVGFDEFQAIVDQYMLGQEMAVRYAIGKEHSERDPATIPNMTPF